MEKNNQFERFLYSSRFETGLQKLGVNLATDLVSEFIASGKIYKGQDAKEMSSDDKYENLVEFGLHLLDKGIKEQETNKVVLEEIKPEVKDGTKAENPKQEKKQKPCCQIF
eukprot:CAMPEP_0176469396 /NCGR_PEP_ID=MMETSP0127-20121128/39767_1 /TAXON_ID=938130 /ORGANISM="Platyophrya macrostoma, Strain WH" /LENGTH=110 /DNA_ID=CAMNT_0017863355 /DNA_START=42 /DNA_END=374 /DNA_ORIENTATION=-